MAVRVPSTLHASTTPYPLAYIYIYIVIIWTSCIRVSILPSSGGIKGKKILDPPIFPSSLYFSSLWFLNFDLNNFLIFEILISLSFFLQNYNF